MTRPSVRLASSPPARAVAALSALALAAASCEPSPASDAGPADAATDAPHDAATDTGPAAGPFELLSQYRLFEGTGASLRPAAGVVPYEVVSPLFSDDTVKRRYIALPRGARARYHETDAWTFPPGTIVIKTFLAPGGARLLETRLLIRGETGWTAQAYVWNDAQTDAVRTPGGAQLPADWITVDGARRPYLVPNRDQCATCHGERGTLDLLGVRTRQMNRAYDYGRGPENQIDHFQSLGMLESAPPPAPMRETLVDPAVGSAPLFDRVRSYFDANCAHCHNPRGAASSSGLFLQYANVTPATLADPVRRGSLGVCRTPFSAGAGTCGRDFDIVPGAPDLSIMHCRVASTNARIKMPPISQLADTAGARLLAEWITAMPRETCGAAPVDAGRD